MRYLGVLDAARPGGDCRGMANVKTTAYIDAVNNIARQKMLADIQRVMEPWTEVTQSLRTVCLELRDKIDELQQRVSLLEQHATAEHEVVNALNEYLDAPNEWHDNEPPDPYLGDEIEGGAEIPQRSDATQKSSV